jgi:predicted RNA-binding Zn-ribbon protein involved in translation (DUF1610 family)
MSGEPLHCAGCTAPLATADKKICPACGDRLCVECETCLFDQETPNWKP